MYKSKTDVFKWDLIVNFIKSLELLTPTSIPNHHFNF